MSILQSARAEARIAIMRYREMQNDVLLQPFDDEADHAILAYLKANVTYNLRRYRQVQANQR